MCWPPAANITGPQPSHSHRYTPLVMKGGSSVAMSGGSSVCCTGAAHLWTSARWAAAGCFLNAYDDCTTMLTRPCCLPGCEVMQPPENCTCLCASAARVLLVLCFCIALQVNGLCATTDAWGYELVQQVSSSSRCTSHVHRAHHTA